MSSTEDRRGALRSNLETIRSRIAAAAARGGRPAEDVALCAVTKYIDTPEVEMLIELGVRHLGENRVQAAGAKVRRSPGVSWHMIGHLQRNKARRAVELFDVIQSADSIRLARKLDEEAKPAGRVLPVLIEANVTGEASKTGLAPELCDELFDAFEELPHLAPRGVMAMAPLTGDPGASRAAFRRAVEIRDRGRDRTGLPLPDLSMGMSGDFEVAIEEGATIVRIGSALYRGLGLQEG